MKIEPSKTYLTAAGYVVVIAKGEGTHCLLSTVETSPGVMFNGKNIHESNTGYTGRNKHLGWYYDIGGRCTSTNDEWREKLRITEELPFSLPTLPTGYKWKGDFPQYRVPVLKEQFLGQTAVGSLDGSVVKCCKYWLGVSEGEKRLIVEPMNTAPQIEPIASQSSSTRYYKLTPRDTALFAKRVGDKMGFVYANDLDPNLRYNWNISDENEVKTGRWKEITQEEADKIIMESKTSNKKDLTESGKYKLLGSGDKFTKGVTECDSKGSFNKCDYSGNVSDHMKYNFRDPVVATPQKYRDIDPIKDTPEDHDEFLNESSGRWIVRNSVNGKKNASFDLTTKYRRPITSPVPIGMIEVTHLPDYIMKRNGDVYTCGGILSQVSSLSGTSEFGVKWFTDISPTDYKLYATKENYNEWLASQEAQRKKKVDESRAKLLGEMRNTTVKINGEEIKGAKVSDPVTTFASTTGLVIPTNNDPIWLKSPVVKSGIGRRAFNYWLGDPIKTITKEVKAALPYVVLGGSAWGITYSVFHIEEIKEYYNTHVPSVSISIDAPEILSQ